MKKIFTIAMALFMVLTFMQNTFAQVEKLNGGNMENQSQWLTSSLNSQVDVTVNWGYTTQTPAQGSGGCLNVMATVAGTEGATESQFAIYQQLQLSGNLGYFFDAAFKDLSDNLAQNWLEVYVGQKPVDGEAYDSNDGTLLAQFNGWNDACTGKNVDGTFKLNSCHNGFFIPDTNGTYYFVIKIGNGDWGGNQQSFNILIDELSLIETTVKPMPAFDANVTNGFAPLTVNFTDKSKLAETWSWNFGDGNTSAEQNPVHIYQNAGVYTVSLTVTNAVGDSSITKNNFIEVKLNTQLPVNGVLVGGNMENQNLWQISYLNTPEGNEPTAEWNYTANKPGAGQGGNLRVYGKVNNYQTQYCIYQQVNLLNMKRYTFNGAFKDITENITNTWVEVYIGSKPVDGDDYGTNQIKIASFSTWDNCTPAKVDGTFALDACYNGVFIPDTTGTYFFVIKMGVIDWESVDRNMDILIDELSLIEENSVPYTAFSADNLTGFAPFTVNFINNSKMAATYEWDFGDGNTSTDQNPVHTYQNVGKYNVSLKAVNTYGDSTLTKTGYITVNQPVSLPNGEKLYGSSMEDANMWTITNLNATTIPTATWNYTDELPNGGVGGCLHVTATVNNTTSQFCIWQKVELLADSVYIFDGLFKDVNGIDHFWCEIYISDIAPEDNKDFSPDSTKISYFNTWENAGKGVNGTFSEFAINPANPFKPKADGTYYFVLKMGNNDWESTDFTYEVLIDELSLKETTPVVLPEADFVADASSADKAPFTVQFFNLSKNANAYEWWFGDGQTSTDFEPSHTYTTGGAFTVTLIAKSENATDTLIKSNLIMISVSVPENSKPELLVYPNPANSSINFYVHNNMLAKLNLYNVQGRLLTVYQLVTGLNTIDVANLQNGIYFIEIKHSNNTTYTQKLLICK